MILAFRFFIAVFILVLIAQKALIFKLLSCFFFIGSVILSFSGFYASQREKILGLLADKITFTCVLVMLADLRMLDVILVAWIIGVVFLQTGVDLLQSSLKTEGFNIKTAWFKNMCYMVLTFFSLLLFAFEYKVSLGVYWPLHHILSVLWFVLTLVFVAQAFFSDKLHKLMRDA